MKKYYFFLWIFLLNFFYSKEINFNSYSINNQSLSGSKHFIFNIAKKNKKSVGFILLSNSLKIMMNILFYKFYNEIKKKKDNLSTTNNEFLWKFFIGLLIINLLEYYINNYLKYFYTFFSFKLKNTLINLLINGPYETYGLENNNELYHNINTTNSLISSLIIGICRGLMDILFSFLILYRLFGLNKNIALINILLAVLTFSFNYFIMKKNKSLWKKVINNKDVINNKHKNLLDNFMIIKIFSLEKYMMNWFVKDEIEYQKNQIKLNKQYTYVFQWFQITQYFYICCGLYYLFNHKAYSEMLLFLTINQTLWKSFNNLFGLFRSIIKDYNEFDKIFKSFPSKITNEKPFKNLKFTGNFKIINGNKSIKDNLILSQINLDINDDLRTEFQKKGLKIGLIGPSGCGKSTLLKTINNLYQLDNNGLFVEIIDGNNKKTFIPIKDLHPKDISNNIGFLPQENYIFLTNLKNNITLFEDIPMDIIEQAIKSSQLKSLIMNKGLEYEVLENGKNLSGGQIRRVNIARTIAKSLYQNIHPILLLDEPETGLDHNNFQLLMDEIFKIYKDTIIIISTHNPEIMKQMDILISMDNGKIISIKKNIKNSSLNNLVETSF